MKVQYLSTTLLTLWANLALTHAFYGPRDDVTELTPRNFKTALLDTNVSCSIKPFRYQIQLGS